VSPILNHLLAQRAAALEQAALPTTVVVTLDGASVALPVTQPLTDDALLAQLLALTPATPVATPPQARIEVQLAPAPPRARR
jgi:hypothetical protein